MIARRSACGCRQLHVACKGNLSGFRCLIASSARSIREPGMVPSPPDHSRRKAPLPGSLACSMRLPFDSAVCDSTIYWEMEGFPDVIGVAVGAFAGPTFPATRYSVWERRRRRWLENAVGSARSTFKLRGRATDQSQGIDARARGGGG